MNHIRFAILFFLLLHQKSLFSQTPKGKYYKKDTNIVVTQNIFGDSVVALGLNKGNINFYGPVTLIVADPTIPDVLKSLNKHLVDSLNVEIKKTKIALRKGKIKINSNYKYYFAIGKDLFFHRRYVDAMTYFDSTIISNPLLDSAFFLRALSNIKNAQHKLYMPYYNNYQLAIIDLNNYILMNGNNVDAFRWMAFSYCQVYDTANARKCIDHLFSLPIQNSFDYELRGRQFDSQGKNDSAILVYNKSLLLDSSNIMTYFDRANYYSMNNQYYNAISDYKYILQKDSSNIITGDLTMFYYNLGNLFFQSGQNDSSIHYYELCSENEPNSIFYNSLAFAYMRKYRYKEAAAAFEKSVFKDSVSQQARGNFPNIALCYLNIGDYQNATKYYLKYINNSSEKIDVNIMSDYLACKGLLYFASNFYDSSKKYFDSAINILPTGMNYYNRAKLYIHDSNWENAISYLKKSISLMGNIGVHYYDLAYSKYMSKSYGINELFDDLNNAIKYKNTEAELGSDYYLAALFYKNNKKNKKEICKNLLLAKQYQNDKAYEMLRACHCEK